jgi:Arc/MetJ family transcription regulator
LYVSAVKSVLHEVQAMTTAITSIRLDTKLADEAVRVLGVKTRTEAVHMALLEILQLRRFKKLMKDNEGRLTFANYDK